MTRLRHAILGVGGIGGLMGACLARCGSPVSVVVRPEMLDRFPEQLQLDSVFGNFSVPVSRGGQVPPCDVLWIAVKATQLEAALTAITTPESVRAIVPLLNGIDHLAVLRGKYGAGRSSRLPLRLSPKGSRPGTLCIALPLPA